MPTPTPAPAPTQRPSCVGCAASQSWSGRAFLFLFVLVSLVELFGTWTPAQKHLFQGIQIVLLVYAAIVLGLRAVRAYRAIRHHPTL